MTFTRYLPKETDNWDVGRQRDRVERLLNIEQTNKALDALNERENVNEAK
jgi:hypothetical protein